MGSSSRPLAALGSAMLFVAACTSAASKGPAASPTSNPAGATQLTGVTPSPTSGPTIDVTTLAGKIVFATGGGFVVMNADGSGQKQVAGAASSFEAWPAFSPDGTRIAFSSRRDSTATKESDELYVMKADGSEQTRLTHDGGYAWLPSWSPDGRRIVFECSRGNVQQVCVIGVDGSGEAQLTSDPLGDRDPALSSDGTKILFLKSGHLNGPISVMNADGSNEQALTSNPDDSGPAFSPDGSTIAFARGPADGISHIYVMNADGSGQTELIVGGGPAWSPDGRRIVFGRSDGIYVMNADGSGVTRLSADPTAWGPDWGR